MADKMPDLSGVAAIVEQVRGLTRSACGDVAIEPPSLGGADDATAAWDDPELA